MSLNAEPSRSEERAELHLPPKSYANVVEQDTRADTVNIQSDAPKEEGQMPNGVSEGSTLTNGTYSIDGQQKEGDGAHLKTGKPDEEHKELTRQAKKEESERRSIQKENSSLVKGKRAGDGWHRSGCLFPHYKQLFFLQ
jgi:hypothetical protein